MTIIGEGVVFYNFLLEEPVALAQFLDIVLKLAIEIARVAMTLKDREFLEILC